MDNTKKNNRQEQIEFLRSCELFTALQPSALKTLIDQFEVLDLKADDILCRQYVLSNKLHVVLSGSLHRISQDGGREIDAGIIQPGASFEENALLIGEQHTATIKAMSDSRVLSLDGKQFQAFGRDHPELHKQFSEIIMDRLQRQEMHEILFVSQLFCNMSDDALKALEKELELVTCLSGETLIEEGADSDCAYIVISGRLKVLLRRQAKDDLVLTELCRGQTVGEIAIITGGKRTATVRAIRDSLVARLSKKAFDRLLKKFPQDIMKQFAGSIITQLQEQTTGRTRLQNDILNIAIIATHDNVAIDAFTEQLTTALENIAPTLSLSASRMDHYLSPEGIAQTPIEDPNSVNIARWLNQQESNYRYILYQADNAESEWTKRCIHQADRILLVGNAEDNAERSAIETDVLENDAYQHLKKNLVLIHQDSSSVYNRTHEWISIRNLQNHYHIVVSNTKDYNRIGRLLTGNGVGLVVSGGGARGFAHIGGIKALKEAGINIDKIGGTSMGSIVAAMFALGWDYDRMLKQVMSFNYKLDYTFPAVSLTSGNNLTSGLKQRLGNQQIEDLPLSFFCVSTDLSRASQKKHTSGSLWKYVRASTSIPGLFPPIIDSGSFLVDGAIVNNMPVDIMAKCEDIGTVIAFDVSAPCDLETGYEIDGSLSGWSVIASWMNPFKKSVTLPRLSKTLIHTSLTRSAEATETTKNMADFYIKFPMREYGLIDFNNIPKIVETGYQFAKDKINEWKQAGLNTD